MFFSLSSLKTASSPVRDVNCLKTDIPLHGTGFSCLVLLLCLTNKGMHSAATVSTYRFVATNVTLRCCRVNATGKPGAELQLAFFWGIALRHQVIAT
jgi:hypothetical protein